MKLFWFFILSWFLSGLISAIGMIVLDLRGEPFDEDYFDKDLLSTFCLVTVFGYLSLLLLFFEFIIVKINVNGAKEKLFRLIHRVANVGYKSGWIGGEPDLDK